MLQEDLSKTKCIMGDLTGIFQLSIRVKKVFFYQSGLFFYSLCFERLLASRLLFDVLTSRSMNNVLYVRASCLTIPFSKRTHDYCKVK